MCTRGGATWWAGSWVWPPCSASRSGCSSKSAPLMGLSGRWGSQFIGLIYMWRLTSNELNFIPNNNSALITSYKHFTILSESHEELNLRIKWFIPLLIPNNLIPLSSIWSLCLKYNSGQYTHAHWYAMLSEMLSDPWCSFKTKFKCLILGLIFRPYFLTLSVLDLVLVFFIPSGVHNKCFNELCGFAFLSVFRSWYAHLKTCPGQGKNRRTC